MSDPRTIAERVECIEAHVAIQQLAIRYALTVDAPDGDPSAATLTTAPAHSTVTPARDGATR